MLELDQENHRKPLISKEVLGKSLTSFWSSMLVYVASNQWNFFRKACVPKECKEDFSSWKVG